MDFQAVEIFITIIELGSFTAAAQKLRLPKQTVSRKITTLENKLGVRLMERSTRHLRLTSSGERFLQYAQDIHKVVRNAKKEFTHFKENPQGILRIATPPLVGDLFLRKVLSHYIETFPKVQLEILYTDQLKEPIRDQFDVVLWSGNLPQFNVIAKHITSSWTMLYASPLYIEKHGVPTSLEELSSHSCIQLNAQLEQQWILQSDSEQRTIRPNFRIKTNNFWLAYESCLNGQGISLLPVMLCGDKVRSKHLVPILPEWFGVTGGLYALFPSRKLLASPVRAFLNLLDKFKDKNLTKAETYRKADASIAHYLEHMHLSLPEINYHFSIDVEK
ncbi:MAG: LysR family transcriptional regulator [Myxococcota bacterium]|nr:LysR family transcriptional regulator [Myxococcota bacterium]